MQKIKRSVKDLEREYFEQVSLLHNSCIQFDRGFEIIAKSIATTLRLLLHDTKSSHSLLKQLNEKNNFFDSSYSVFSLIVMQGDEGATTGEKRLFLDHFGHRRYAPVLNKSSETFQRLGFESWWNQRILKSKTHYFSRREVVLAVANQDGGAHVDPYIEQEYYNLTRLNSHGFCYVKKPFPHQSLSENDFLPSGPPHFVTVRQIAHEVLISQNSVYYYDGSQHYPKAYNSGGTQLICEPKHVKEL